MVFAVFRRFFRNLGIDNNSNTKYVSVIWEQLQVIQNLRQTSAQGIFVGQGA